MLQVAAYCRVSTDKEDQANSFEAQQRYFREYIQRQPDWELQGIYADEGFSGYENASGIRRLYGAPDKVQRLTVSHAGDGGKLEQGAGA